MTLLPNLVLIVCDGWNAAPAGEGWTTFAGCFAPSPIVAANRCSLMTGWYPHVRGHRTDRDRLTAAEPMLLKRLMEKGYFVWWGGSNETVRADDERSVCSARYPGNATDGVAVVEEAVRRLAGGLPRPFCLCLTLRGAADAADDGLARLGAALREAGAWHDCAVFAVGDPAEGDYDRAEAGHGFHAPGFDDRFRVRLALKLPAGLAPPPQDRPIEAPAELIDVYATAAELAALPERHTQFGRSLVPVACGRTDRHRAYTFSEWDEPAPDGGAAVRAVMMRAGRWTYVRRTRGPEELYELRDDPEERRNRAADPHCADVRRELLDRLARWYMETVDTVPFEPILPKLERRG